MYCMGEPFLEFGRQIFLKGKIKTFIWINPIIRMFCKFHEKILKNLAGVTNCAEPLRQHMLTDI